VLVHHAYARRQRRARLAGRQQPAMHPNFARIGDVVAKEDGHQRGLARAVLAEQGQHFAARELQADAVIGHQRPEAFGDAAQLQDGFRHAGRTVLI